MIIALLFVIVFVIGIVLIPLGWWSGSIDVREALLIWLLLLATLYLLDIEIIHQVAITNVNFFTSLPWVGAP
jgi:hypothetical protein